MKPTPEEKCEMGSGIKGDDKRISFRGNFVSKGNNNLTRIDSSPSPEARVDWENLIQKTINNETVRNNPETTVHEFSEVCSCWTCHLSSILAIKIQAAFEKGREAR